jgi:hypothetical protein
MLRCEFSCGLPHLLPAAGEYACQESHMACMGLGSGIRTTRSLLSRVALGQPVDRRLLPMYQSCKHRSLLRPPCFKAPGNYFPSCSPL